MAPPERAEEWQSVCAMAELEPLRGVIALVRGQAVAIFRLEADDVYALGDHDPFTKSGHLARGIVGVRNGVPFVASVANRHSFDLRDGRCLEDAHVSVPAYDVRVSDDGVVLVGQRKTVAA